MTILKHRPNKPDQKQSHERSPDRRSDLSEPVGHEFARRHRTTNPETDAHGGIELSIGVGTDREDDRDDESGESLMDEP